MFASMLTTIQVPLTIAAMDYIENAILTVLFFIFEEGNLNGGVLARLLASVVPLVQTIKVRAVCISHLPS